MNRYLLDTNVISEYSRPWPPDSGVRAWVDAQNEDVLHLSVLTLGLRAVVGSGNRKGGSGRSLEGGAGLGQGNLGGRRHLGFQGGAGAYRQAALPVGLVLRRHGGRL